MSSASGIFRQQREYLASLIIASQFSRQVIQTQIAADFFKR